jgi:hypothetical protein
MVRDWIRPAHTWVRSTSAVVIPFPRRLFWWRVTLQWAILAARHLVCRLGLHRREAYERPDGYPGDRCRDCAGVWLTATFDG